MNRGLLLVVSFAFLAFAASARAQAPMGKDAKTPPGTAKPGPDPKTADVPKVDPKKSVAPTLPKLADFKLPAGAILALFDTIKESLPELVAVDPKTGRPRFVLLSSDEYQELKNRIAAFEKQLKGEKRVASSCKLSGRVEGDLVFLRAEFAFATEAPNAQVFLGMQGAHLADEGTLDRSAAVLDVGDDGIVVRVEREGTHQLVLNLRLPAAAKRTGALGGIERGFDLGLPGAAVTTLSFETHPAVKELRWNDNVERTRIQGKWELTLGKTKNLAVQWKEPVGVPGSGPLQVVESSAVVQILESHIETKADLVLEDLRGQTKEWVLLLPPQARIVKTVPSAGIEIAAPDAKNPLPTLKLKEPTFERIVASVQMRLPRSFPQQRIPLGPFSAQGASRNQGTILVQASPEGLRGQRPIFHRGSDMFQREPPPGGTGLENLAYFQFWDSAGNKAKSGLDLELKTEKSPIEVRTDVEVAVREEGDWRILDTVVRFQGKAAAGSFETLDVQMPAARMPPVALAAEFGAVGTGGWVPLLGALSPAGRMAPASGWFAAAEEGGEPSPFDSLGRQKIRVASPSGQVVVRGRHWIPANAARVRLELPRPLGVTERGGKESIAAPKHLELLLGPLDEPAPLRHEHRGTFDQLPVALEWAWRPYRPETTAVLGIDVFVHERTARVRQTLALTPALRALRPVGTGSQIPLRLPQGVDRPTVLQGGKLTAADKDLAWLQPDGDHTAEAVFEYDIPLAARDGNVRMLRTDFVRAELATRQEAKVRIWTDSGIFPYLADADESVWKDRGTEIVAGQESLPSRVLVASGPAEPLKIVLDEGGLASSVPFAGDRALIQVQADAEGNLRYRARFLIRKWFARRLEAEMPTTLDQCKPQVFLDQKALPWSRPDPARNVISVPVEPSLYVRPVVLEFDYTVPAGAIEGGRPWSLSLHLPRFADGPHIGQVRWQVGLAAPSAAFVMGSTPVDYRWGWQGWLLAPEPSLTSRDLDQAFSGAESSDDSSVALTFSRANLEPVVVYAMPRLAWLLVCSATVLLIGLGLSSISSARGWGVWIAFFAGVGFLWLGMFNQSFAAAMIFGFEPGLLVLALLLGFQWLMRERYRRRLVFMPGFARTAPGSSLIRNPQKRQTSTIDVPAVGSAPGSAK